eukprot:snap_masked-scaffold_42-processed-gene-0.8-mRNA-1 protein AED:1.00 eAED:1.00 QI:0/0/0/0/1/1/2/0/74
MKAHKKTSNLRKNGLYNPQKVRKMIYAITKHLVRIEKNVLMKVKEMRTQRTLVERGRILFIDNLSIMFLPIHIF